jgi:hypothetical protein
LTPPAPSMVLCPYCGNAQAAPANRCTACAGFFDPLSRKVSQQHMGAWYIRDANNPFRPGCAYETLVKMVQANKLAPDTIMRGPSTRQFWTVAWRVPGVSHLLGYCFSCEKKVMRNAESCPHCSVKFPTPNARDHMGLDAHNPNVMQEVAQARAAEAAQPAPNQPIQFPAPQQPTAQPAPRQPIQFPAPQQPAPNQPIQFPAPQPQAQPQQPAAPSPQPTAPAPSQPTPKPATARVIQTIPAGDDAPPPVPVQPAANRAAPRPDPEPPTDDMEMNWEARAEVNFGRVGASLQQTQRRKGSRQLVVGLVCINLLLILAVALIFMLRSRKTDGLKDNSDYPPPKPPTTAPTRSDASPPSRDILDAFI